MHPLHATELQQHYFEIPQGIVHVSQTSPSSVFQRVLVQQNPTDQGGVVLMQEWLVPVGYYSLLPANLIQVYNVPYSSLDRRSSNQIPIPSGQMLISDSRFPQGPTLVWNLSSPEASSVPPPLVPPEASRSVAHTQAPSPVDPTPTPLLSFSPEEQSSILEQVNTELRNSPHLEDRIFSFSRRPIQPLKKGDSIPKVSELRTCLVGQIPGELKQNKNKDLILHALTTALLWEQDRPEAEPFVSCLGERIIITNRHKNTGFMAFVTLTQDWLQTALSLSRRILLLPRENVLFVLSGNVDNQEQRERVFATIMSILKKVYPHYPHHPLTITMSTNDNVIFNAQKCFEKFIQGKNKEPASHLDLSTEMCPVNRDQDQEKGGAEPKNVATSPQTHDKSA